MSKIVPGRILWFGAMLAAACGEAAPTAVCEPTDAACNPTDTTTTTPPPPLAVTMVSPPDGATAVQPSANVSVTFSRAVSSSSVSATTFKVGTLAGDRTVTGATVTFVPTAPFAEGAVHDIVIDGVTDVAGVGLAAPFTSSFTTLTRPVLADAGPDFDVSMAAQATLDKGASTGTGATFTWTQLSGPSVGALVGDEPTFVAPVVVADLAFELRVSAGTTTDLDTVRVWVLEDASEAIWVSVTGSPSNPGTRAAPLSSIQTAIDAADNAGNGADVYIAAGSYDETLTLRSRVSLYGGFDADEWTRDVASQRPVVSGDTIAARGTSASSLTVEGIEFVSADASSVGGSSVAILLDDSNGVLLTRNVIRAGNGATGAAGTTPARARTGSAAADGGSARLCVVRTAGGARGVNYRDGGTGGEGGGTNPTAGSVGEGVSGGNAGGLGTGGSKHGLPGGNGKAAGAAGANGAAGTGFGAVGASGQYDPSAAKGSAGGAGAPGYGGGGGGGAYGLIGFCGGSGGGGGGGGEGGSGGTAGSGGGASFAVLVVGQGTVQIVDNDIRTGIGGAGGAGASGGLGGFGGQGGDGGIYGCDSIIPSLCTGSGGDGGNGSTGGQGGHGGGGGGGPSIGIVEGAEATVTQTDNVFTLGGGGGGGPSQGNAGPAGENDDHKKL